MAMVSKCMMCQKCRFPFFKCEIYENGIPKDVINEIDDCKHYKPPTHSDTPEDDLPIAKGR